jgi:predicted nucleic acid-binding protein
VKHLLDVNLLIAGIVQTHSLHLRAHTWLRGKQIVLCPLVELGFLRICTNHKSGIGLTMERARNVLEKFSSERGAERIPDDLPALASRAPGSDQVTDHYLANLASQHGLKLATFDLKLRHSSAELVS